MGAEGADVTVNRDGTVDGLVRTTAGREGEDWVEYASLNDWSWLGHHWSIRIRVNIQSAPGVPEYLKRAGATDYEFLPRRADTGWANLTEAVASSVDGINAHGWNVENIELLFRFDPNESDIDD
jgi:hypothetical protein